MSVSYTHLDVYKRQQKYLFRLQVNCSSELKSLHIYKNISNIPVVRAKRDSVLSDHALFVNRRKRSLLESNYCHYFDVISIGISPN